MKTAFVRVAALGVLSVVAVVVLSQTAQCLGGLGDQRGLGDALEKTLDKTTRDQASFRRPFAAQRTCRRR